MTIPAATQALELIHIDGRLDAPSKLREHEGKSVDIVFLAKAWLHVNAYAAKLVDEMT